MKKSIVIVCLFSALTTSLIANTKYTSKFDKPYLIGFAFNNSWSSFAGKDLPQKYFYKPSLGAHIKGEFYVKPYLGIGLSAGFQQRGAGIKTQDLDQSLGNPDSSSRWRIRFNTIDIPFYVVLRTPKPIFKGVKLNASIGFNWHRNFKSTSIFYSVEDGFHNKMNVSNDYYKNSNLSFYSAVGLDIDAGFNLFQIQCVYNPGINNVYNNSTQFNQSVARNRLIGLQIAFLY